VEDHDAREGLGCVYLRMVEGRLVRLLDYAGGVVADVASCAVILIGLGTGDIEDAISECTKCYRGMAYSRGVGECHFQHAPVVYDWCGDVGDEEKNRSCEKEECRNMMKDTSLSHLDVIIGVVAPATS